MSKQELKQHLIAEHNAKYAVMSDRRKMAEKFVTLLKAPKANGENLQG